MKAIHPLKRTDNIQAVRALGDVMSVESAHRCDTDGAEISHPDPMREDLLSHDSFSAYSPSAVRRPILPHRHNTTPTTASTSLIEHRIHTERFSVCIRYDALSTRTNGRDPGSTHRRCVPRDIMSAESAHRCSTDSVDADSSQITRGECRQTLSENRAVPLFGVPVPGWARHAGCPAKRALRGRCGSISASCRCSRTSRRRLLFSDTETARAEGPSYAERVPSAGSVLEHGQPLPSGGPRCAYIHPARADCVYMPGRRSSPRAVRYDC